MRTVTIAAYSNDKRHRMKRKYDNAPDSYPVRDTAPDLSQLSEFGKWLFNNVPRDCSTISGGFMKVTVFNGKSTAETLRGMTEQKLREYGWGSRERAEKFIKAYDLENEQSSISDYLFPKISDHESDTEYWQRVENYIKSGGVRVKIGKNEFVIE